VEAEADAIDAIDSWEVISATEVQGTLEPVLNRVREKSQRVVITQGGKATAVLLDIDEYNELVELAELAELEEMIVRAEEADATDDIVDWEDAKREVLGWLQEK
jgi:prevent-host-death family protein